MIAVGLHLPLQLRWRELVVAALATSSGFAMGRTGKHISRPAGGDA
jgi:hypothetical protein